MSTKTITRLVCDGCGIELDRSDVHLSIHIGQRRRRHFDFCGMSCISRFIGAGRYP